jgi:hypothetical protein
MEETNIFFLDKETNMSSIKYDAPYFLPYCSFSCCSSVQIDTFVGGLLPNMGIRFSFLVTISVDPSKLCKLVLLVF